MHYLVFIISFSLMTLAYGLIFKASYLNDCQSVAFHKMQRQALNRGVLKVISPDSLPLNIDCQFLTLRKKDKKGFSTVFKDLTRMDLTVEIEGYVHNE